MKPDQCIQHTAAGEKAFVSFTINGQLYNVSSDTDVHYRLTNFIRQQAGLTGTKFMCREGGCGACVVTVTKADPETKVLQTFSVNSCLTPVLSCDGWEITTVEGLGSQHKGYHPLQSQLANGNGTQCGFCSPGMVMSMHGLVKSKKNNVTMQDVEDHLDGNMCRCTGYRPIMDAYKSFASDAPAELKGLCKDLEDLGKCPRTGGPCAGLCASNGTQNGATENHYEEVEDEELVPVTLRGGEWYKPKSVKQLQKLLQILGDKRYRLVAGNTGTGVFKRDGPYEAYIDISKISSLYYSSLQTPLVIGGALNLTRVAELFSSVAQSNPDYTYTTVLAKHVRKIASVPVRNAGSLAGNLMMKHDHHAFPSDVFIMLQTVGAQVNIMAKNGTAETLALDDFLVVDMQGKFITSITLPPLSKGHALRTFKIMPRCHNAHAYVNAGFLAQVGPAPDFRIIGRPRICYGGIRPDFIHAKQTEEFLTDKNLGEEVVLKEALKILGDELKPDYIPPDATPEYRKHLSQALFYKFVLGVLGDSVDPKLRSGALDLVRPLSSGKQSFDLNKDEFPLNEPIPKVEALVQCSGEAQYVNDIPLHANELHGAFVLSTIANASIKQIDSSAALALEGVVAFLDYRDTPASGRNCIFEGGEAPSGMEVPETEEIFSSGKVHYAGQPLGMIVAKDVHTALSAAKLVRVDYEKIGKPILTIKDALKEGQTIEHNAFAPVELLRSGDIESALRDAPVQLEGEFEIGTQYHYTMETQVTRCVPTEDGLDVFCATQDIDTAQTSIAKAVGVKKHKVNMQVRRLGGAYGGKISRNLFAATACAIAATKFNRPVRVAMDLHSNMEAIGGRLPYYCKYKVGVNNDGKLEGVKMDIISDCGWNFNEGTAFFAANLAQNCYDAKAWHVTPYLARTHTPSNTYCRSPGTTQGIAVIENLMEHVAFQLKMDPLELRMKNIRHDKPPFMGRPLNGKALVDIINQVKESSEYEARKQQVAIFNQNNRWKKRGIYLTPMAYPVDYPPVFRYNVLVSIYHGDGSVSISHGGVEMGQGVNTKVAQAAAYELGIPVSMISVKPTNAFTNPNGSTTGGSMTSELNCHAVSVACRQLQERMRPVREELNNPSWEELVETCYQRNVDLCSRHLYTPLDNIPGYDIFGATVIEVELDVLTGERQILRADILEDAGQSLSPLVDIGQVEGAFVMGLGLWLSERVQYDADTGRKLNTSTWDYKPPANKDIPIDFRVTLLHNAPNPFGVLRSKATGEPPLCMSCAVLFALRQAVDAARKDVGNKEWYQLDGPATIDLIQRFTLADASTFAYHS